MRVSLKALHQTRGACHCALLALLIGFIFIPQPLFAQATTAKVVGAVTDSSGAVLPGARVTIVNVETGVSRDATTNEVGNYEFSFLSAGRYTLASSQDGFQRTEVSEFTLTIGQVARVNLSLQLGQVSETIEVQAGAVALKTEDATVGTVIDGQQVVELPLNGRSFVQLATLTPGVLPGTPGSITVRRKRGSLGQDVGMSAAGARDTQNRFYFDGVETMDLDSYNFSFSPSIDAIQEFAVQTSTYSSTTGGAPGGQVNLSTKSGTNAYQGTLWLFNRNDALAALGHFQPYDPDAKPPKLNRNQFGANIGGPIVRNQTHFFFNWESGRQVAGTFGGTALLPPSAYRLGDFSASSAVIVDPDTGNPFPGNRIPSDRIRNYAREFLDGFVPLTNADQPGLNYRGPAASTPTDQNQYITRIDHRFSSAHSLYGTYMYNNQSDDTVPTFGFDTRGNRARGQLASLTDSYVLSSSMVNELRVGWHRFYEHEFLGTTNRPEYDIANLIGIGGVSKNPRDYGAPSFEAGYDLPTVQDEGPRDRLNQNWEISESLSMTKGNHFLKAGAQVMRRNWTYDEALFPRGIFTFDGRTTSGDQDPVEENSFAAFLLGAANGATISPTPYATRQNTWWQSYYFQDDWKIRPNLTVNVGLRYDYFAIPNQRGPLSNFELNGPVPGFTVSRQTFLGFDDIADTPGVPKNLVGSDRNDFGPRIGFAYSPGWAKDLVIRGGFGIYYFPEISNTFLDLTVNPPIIRFNDFTGDYNDTVNPETVFLTGAAGEIRDSLDGAYAFDPDQASSYTQHWNFTVQKKLPAEMYLEVGYVGSAAKNLTFQYDGNRPIEPLNPEDASPVSDRRPLAGFDTITAVKTVGQSSYHSLQLKLERRLARGLSFLGAYTWSHSLNNADISTVGGGSFVGKPQDVFHLAAEKGNAVYDLRHRLSASILYDLPALTGSPAAVRFAFGGWRLGTITTLQSGFAATVVGGGQTTATGVSSRASVVPGQEIWLSRSERSRERWFNTSAFRIPDLGSFGDGSRGNVHLPGLEQVDLMVTKNFRFRESMNLQVRSEFFNVLNHVNLGAPGLNIQGASTFGRITSGQGLARVIQFGLKLQF